MAKRKSLKERMAAVLSASDINFLKNNAPNHPLGYLVQRLGRDAKLIEKELRRLNISPLDAVVNIPIEEPISVFQPTSNRVFNPTSLEKVVSPIEKVVEPVEKVVSPIEKNIDNDYIVIRRPKKPFSEAEVDYLKKQINNLTIAAIARNLGRSAVGVSAKAVKLGIYQINLPENKFSGKDAITDYELAFIKENIANKSIKEIAEELDRPNATIRLKVKQLGLSHFTKGKLKPLDNEEKEYLRKNYSKYSSKQLAEATGISKYLVEKFLNDEGIKPKKIKFERVSLNFNQEELDFIRDNCKTMTRNEIAKHLNKKRLAIKYIVTKNKWGVNKEEANALRSRWSKGNKSRAPVWTAVEEAFINYNFGKLTYTKMAEILKSKTINQIVRYCVARGMRISHEIRVRLNTESSHQRKAYIRAKELENRI